MALPPPQNPHGRIGIIGGSGFSKLPEVIQEIKLTTPYGEPSDSYFLAKIGDIEVIFLARHGRGHRFTPTEVNFRANVYGFKMLHCNWIIGVSAVGSLQEKIALGNIIVIDQFIDKTKHRKDSFFGDGIVGHVPFAEPCCATLRNYVLKACKEVQAKKPELDVTVHSTGTYVNMEGPAFSTIAESRLHQTWGGSVIGMTAVTEAKLCREAEISYSVMAMATDYDAWREGEHVDVETVMATMSKNHQKSLEVIKACLPIIAAHVGEHPSATAMKGNVMTSANVMPRDRAIELWPIIGKYYNMAHIQGADRRTTDSSFATTLGLCFLSAALSAAFTVALRK